MSISKNITEILSCSSWIRKMFEEGARLKAEYGDENVFDFSLEDPNLEPPEEFSQTLKETVNTPHVRDNCGTHLTFKLSAEVHARQRDQDLNAMILNEH